MKQDILAHILGPGDPAFFIAGIIFAIGGIFLSMLIDSAKRDYSNPSTPDYFSWKFMLKDNLIRLIRNVLVIFVTIRFSREIIGAEITMYLSFLIGLGLDKVIKFIINLRAAGPTMPNDRQN